ncbi:MAG: C39 family peptidase [Raoultibacter sp.]
MKRANRKNREDSVIFNLHTRGRHVRDLVRPVGAQSSCAQLFLARPSILLVAFGVVVLVCIALAFGIASCSFSERYAKGRVPAEQAQLEPSPVAFSDVLAAELATLSSMTLTPGDKVDLEVPLIDQMDNDDAGEQLLFNGCEVTSMAMVLQAAGLDVTKEDLAAAIKKVPLWIEVDEAWVHGNPNEGFVGSLDSRDGEAGYSVYHAPVVEVANLYKGSSGLNVIDLTGQDFDTVLKELKRGHAVWIVTTVNFAPTENWEIWETNAGPMSITWDVHSVVLTGFDDEHVFINDPYGEKNVSHDRADFQAAWEQMGKQAVVVHS